MFFFVERLVFEHKIGACCGYNFSIILAHFVEVCEQVVVSWSQIWRIRRMVKQCKLQFVFQFFLVVNGALHYLGETTHLSFAFGGVYL